MDAYLSVLVKRLVPAADEINAYRDDGQILGYARDASGALLAWPTMDEFETEWQKLQAELSATPAPQPEPSVAELQAQIGELQQAMIDLLLMMGGA